MLESSKPACIRTGRDATAGLREDQSGATAIEFAMVVVPFLALLFAIMEVALVYFATFSLENATEQASRMIRTGQAQAAAMSANDFKQAICDRVPVFLDCTSGLKVDVRTFPDFSSAASNPAEPIDDNGNLKNGFEQFSLAGSGGVTLVSVYYKWDLFLDLPSFMGLGLSNLADGGRLISAGTAFRVEPFDS